MSCRSRIVRDQGVAVIVPPLHHRVVTARVAIPGTAHALGDARLAFESALGGLEQDYPLSAAGLCVTVAWGLPYFRRFVPAQAHRAIPIDLRASAAGGREVRVVEDASRFPSDPEETILEENDVAVLLRSDRLDAIDDARAASVRRARRALRRDEHPQRLRRRRLRRADASLPKTMAMRARIRGAAHMPARGRAVPRLHLDGRSTRSGRGRSPTSRRSATRGSPTRYFAGGTHMHLSHLFENLNAWYLNFDRASASTRCSGPGSDREHEADGRARRRRRPDGRLGTRRLRPARAHRPRGRDPVGLSPRARTSSARTARVYPKGTAVPQRADFNTLDNPFAWSAHPKRDRHARRARRRRPLRRLQPHRRRLPSRSAGDGRRPPRRASACPSSRARSARGSTRCSTRPTARTSSSRRGHTARSRSPSSARERSLQRLEARLEEPQLRGLVRHAEARDRVALLEDLRDRLGGHVHVRLRVDAARDRQPHEFELRPRGSRPSPGRGRPRRCRAPSRARRCRRRAAPRAPAPGTDPASSVREERRRVEEHAVRRRSARTIGTPASMQLAGRGTRPGRRAPSCARTRRSRACRSPSPPCRGRPSRRRCAGPRRRRPGCAPARRARRRSARGSRRC